MVDRLTLHVGDEPCYVDDCHVPWTLPSRPMAVPNDAPASDGAPRPGGSASTIDADGVLDLFGRITDRAAQVLSATTDWGESGRRPGQYLVDLDVDDVCVGPLLAAGFGVLSEESGLQFPAGAVAGDAVVVVDPLDGSTNASLGVPWCATSLCLVVDREPQVAMVTNLVTGQRWTAIRGSGAALGGRPIAVERRATLDDAFVAMSANAHGVWDYVGAQLVVTEAGGVMVDADGRDLVVLDPAARRTPVAATGAGLLRAVLTERAR